MDHTTSQAAADDLRVIDAVLRGEVEQYAALVDRYQAAAWKIAYGMVGNVEDARELSQNGFVKAYANLNRFRRDAKFSTWLYRIVMNECKDFLRRRRRPMVALDARDEDGRLEFEVEDPSAGPQQQAMNRELGQALGRAIQELPANQHTAFVLHHVHGLAIGEVADVMGCRSGTVKSHLFRACHRLQTRVNGWGGTHHDA
ncbi:MAG: sigma-70 family RNA polymerase sigma factor [Candidatus Omnitrophica bacterium]|nr:sigma-70 family RNA polymerase sigma factor [Candidatus Omnitrophota bacterium]